MDLARDIVLRYRSPGHVRFDLPEALCLPQTAGRLVAELKRIEGVYRVDLSPRQRKLSIRFLEQICDFRILGQKLYLLIAAADWQEQESSPAEAGPVPPTGTRVRPPSLSPMRWLRSKWQEARETAMAMKVLSQRADVRERAQSLFKEETVIFILNDALALYLIKLHWPLMSQQWIRNPWLHRYEWMASGYLVYLFVRSRRPAE
jgi:hypothetical protein